MIKRLALLNLLTMVVKSRVLKIPQAIKWQKYGTGTQHINYSLERRKSYSVIKLGLTE